MTPRPPSSIDKDTKDTTMKAHHLIVAALFSSLSLVACSKSESKDGAKADAPGAAAVDMKAAKEMFDSRCAACHGTSGKGDGPGAAALNPKPRDYTDKAWQKTVTDDQLKKVIVYGGAAVGKSPIMPASPDLDAKPDVVAGMIKVIRDFGK